MDTNDFSAFHIGSQILTTWQNHILFRFGNITPYPFPHLQIQPHLQNNAAMSVKFTSEHVGDRIHRNPVKSPFNRRLDSCRGGFATDQSGIAR
ncbi:hypothetical protein E4U54_000772 [Claviceps lovelessii]|nr:hypothetical protein E4U54_000772 [Claviceps lovelessii]